MIRVANRISALEEYYFSSKLATLKALGAQGPAVINLGVGSPDLQPDESVIQALVTQATAAQANAYQPYRGTDALRNGFRDWMQGFFGVSLEAETEILPLLGSKEGIMLSAMAYVNPGDEVLIPNPGYPTYSSVAQMVGAQAVYYDLKAENNWFPDLDSLAKRDWSRAKLMWVNYPHMPSGARACEAQLQALVDFARQHDILLINDNPYALILNPGPLSILQATGAKSVALEFTSLSKAYAMAGWRVGAVMGCKAFIDPILRVKSHRDSGMYLPIQQAAVQALSLPPSWIAAQDATYARRRALLWAICDDLGLRYEKQTAGLFVWARLPEGVPDDKAWVDEKLERHRVFMAPGSIFGSNGKGYVRLSLCASEAQLTLARKRLKTCV